MDRRYWFALGALVLVAVPLVGLAVGDFHAGPNGASLHVEASERDIPATETVRYDLLSAEQRQVFERALDSDEGYVSIPQGMNRTVWIENRGVRYESETYVVAVAVP